MRRDRQPRVMRDAHGRPREDLDTLATRAFRLLAKAQAEVQAQPNGQPVSLTAIEVGRRLARRLQSSEARYFARAHECCVEIRGPEVTE